MREGRGLASRLDQLEKGYQAARAVFARWAMAILIASGDERFMLQSV